MKQHDTLASIADRIQAAWASGRVCSLVASGCWGRIVGLNRLVDEGRIGREEALKLAMEVEALSLCFAPLPAGDLTRDHSRRISEHRRPRPSHASRRR